MDHQGAPAAGAWEPCHAGLGTPAMEETARLTLTTFLRHPGCHAVVAGLRKHPAFHWPVLLSSSQGEPHSPGADLTQVPPLLVSPKN